jgi:hypothetical protein
MHRGVNPGNLQPTRKKKASPRPPDWFKRFQQSLERNPGTQRLRTELLPQCELFNLALFVVEYVRDSNPPELEKRRQRGLWRGKVLREQEAFLRKKVRTLKRQLSTAAIYDPGRHRERELETSITKLAATRDMLARAQEAHNTKRLGVSAAQYRLFVIPEYVRIKSGLTLQPC